MTSRTFLWSIIVIVAGTLSASSVAANEVPTISGAPSEWTCESSSAPAPLFFPGLDDQLLPLREYASPLPGSPSAVDAAAVSPTRPDLNSSLCDQLRSIPSEVRPAAKIELESCGQISPAQLVAARTIEQLWNGGRCEAAIEALREIEDAGARMGLGISWTGEAAQQYARNGVDVRLGGTRIDARAVSIDFDGQSGNLFSVIQWGSLTGTSVWTTNISTDHGATWSETYAWGSSVGIIDVDAAVVDDWVYIGYIVGNQQNQVRVRRCHVATGLVDGVYGYQVALDAGASTFPEVAMAANADDYDNRIYCLAFQEDHVLRFAFDVADDGTTWTDMAPPAVADVSFGLDATYNHNYQGGVFLFVSYCGTDQRIHILSRTQTEWTSLHTVSVVGTTRSTSISSYGPNLICALEYPYDEGTGIRYDISYDLGATWNWGDPAIPDGVTVFSYLKPSVDARNGMGTTIIYQAEQGEPDAVFFRFRQGFHPGMWAAGTQFNDFDVVTGTATALGPLSHGAIYFDLGAIYLSTSSVPYFDLPGPGTADSPEVDNVAPSLRLVLAGPNPVRDRALVSFALASPERVRLQIADALGRCVMTLVDEQLGVGAHTIPFNSERLDCGMYFLRLTAGHQEEKGQILVVH